MNIITPPLPTRKLNQLHESVSSDTVESERTSSFNLPLHLDNQLASVEYSETVSTPTSSPVTTGMRRSCMRTGSYSRDTATTINSAVSFNSFARSENFSMEEERIVFGRFSSGDALPINKWDDSLSKSNSHSIGNSASRLTPPARFMMGTSGLTSKPTRTVGAKSHTPSVTWKVCLDSSSSNRTHYSDQRLDEEDSGDDDNHDLTDIAVEDDDDDDDDDGSQLSILVDDVSDCLEEEIDDISNSDDNESVSDGDTGMDLFDKLYAKYNCSAPVESVEIDVDESEHDEGDENVAMKQISESSKSIRSPNNMDDSNNIDEEAKLRETLYAKMKAKFESNNPVYTEDESQYEYGATNDIDDDIAFTMYSFGNADKYPPMPADRAARKQRQRSFRRRDGQGHNLLLRSAVMAAMESNDDDELNGDPRNPFGFRNRTCSYNSTNSGTVSIQSMQDALRNSCGDYGSRKRARRAARNNSHTITNPEDAAAIQSASLLLESFSITSNSTNTAISPTFPSLTTVPSTSQHREGGPTTLNLANGSFSENHGRKHEMFLRSPPMRRVSRKKSYDGRISDDIDPDGQFTDDDSF